MALKAVFEPAHIDIFHTIDATLAHDVPAGRIVMKNPDNGNEVLVSDGSAAYGVLSQNVYVRPTVPGVVLPYNNFEAYVGDPVGIYTEDCYLKTDQYVSGTYNPGDKLYVTSEGKLTNEQDADGTATATTGHVVVGEVIRVEGDMLFFLFKRCLA